MRLIRLLIATFILFGVIVSCTPERKLRRAEKKIHRLTKRYPQLLNSDTIRLPAVDISVSVSVDTNYHYIDSLVFDFRDSLVLRYSSVVPQHLIDDLIESLKDSTRYRKLFAEDTIKHKIDGFTIKIWQSDDKLWYSIDKPEVLIEDKNIIIKKPTIWQEVKPWLWILIVIAVLYAGRKLIKKGIDKIFP